VRRTTSAPTEVPPMGSRASSSDAVPVHWLAAGWRPDQSGLYPRLPEFAAITSPDADRAFAELAVHLPPDARVHLVSPAHVDPALVAEMVLEVDRNLQPWHRDGLREFIDARRRADRQAVRERFTDRDEGFERLRRALRIQGTAGGAERSLPGDGANGSRRGRWHRAGCLREVGLGRWIRVAVDSRCSTAFAGYRTAVASISTRTSG
jgi:hypothetical protein